MNKLYFACGLMSINYYGLMEFIYYMVFSLNSMNFIFVK